MVRSRLCMACTILVPGAAMLLSTAWGQVPAQKAVKPGDTIPRFGTVIDPDKDCQFLPGRTGLTIMVPKAPHSLDNDKRNSPRVMQPVSGDFEVTVRVAEAPRGELPRGVAPKDAEAYYSSAGLLIWKDESHLIRLERALIGRSPGSSQEIVRFGDTDLKILMRRIDGDDRVADDLGGQALAKVEPNNPLWLRIVRKGDRARSEFSHDGKGWTFSRDFPLAWSGELQVGVSASNTLERPFSTKLVELKVEKPR